MATPELPNPRNISLPKPDDIEDEKLKKYLTDLVQKLEEAYRKGFDNIDACRNAIT